MNSFPQFDLTGDVALVTGAGRGLGRAIALALANTGADIALGLRDVSTGGQLAQEIAALGRRVLPLQMDATSRQQIFAAVDDAVAHFGKLDILVNNVGVAPENLAENVTEKDFDNTLTVNLKGTPREPGRWPGHDSPRARAHHQHGFTGGICGASG